MKPNIVIINPDQMRADALRHLGNEASYTPNMDALAQEGVSFSQAFCQNPVCVPSRCSFMTGLYPHVNGHRTMSHLLKRGESNLFKELKDSGYFVWSNGRGDLLAGQDREWLNENMDVLYDKTGCEAGELIEGGRGPKDGDNYFSFYLGPTKPLNGYMVNDTDKVWTDAAVEMIQNHPKDKAMMLFLGLYNPHPPYQVEEKYLEKINIDKLPPRIPSLKGDEGKSSMEMGLVNTLRVKDWSEERFDKLRATYLGMCARIDEQIGQIVQALKEANIYDDTALFILSDHGDYTGDYGAVEKAQNVFADCLTNIPLIIKPPKGAPVQPGVNDNLVELVDFYATALAYAGVTPPHNHFGQSLESTIANKAVPVREFVCCEGGRLHGEEQCMEKSGLPFPMDDYEPRHKLQASEGPEHTKAAMLRTRDYKYVKRLYEKDEFYDLKEDSREQRNQINNPACTAQIQDLKEKMLEWYQATCDIVPLTEDSRFSDEYMINLISRGNGDLKKRLRQEVIEKSRPFNDVMKEIMAKRTQQNK